MKIEQSDSSQIRAELLINVTPNESRVALVENGILQEMHIERQLKQSIVGNIYMGKITRVLPGMQAAFVEIGLEKAAFLHASDIVPHTECVSESDKRNFNAQNISTLVHQGQYIMVQVVKEPLGTKGARLTTDITLPSRYLVFMPGSSYVGVSQRIEQSAERERLRKATQEYVDDNGGFIIRTAAEGVGDHEISQDAAFLRRVWNKVMERKKNVIKPLYTEFSLPIRIIRDFVGAKLDSVVVDSRTTVTTLTDFCSEFMPELADKISLYQGKAPIFEQFDIESEIQNALSRKVALKSGGYLIIDQTEAMTTVDINTGGFVGRRSLEETIFNTNLEATQAIARQLRLRNLGGIIIIDFIDMQGKNHQKRVLDALLHALSFDRAKTNISGFSSLGLVEMTRKRTRESLGHILAEDCPSCNGSGILKTVETVCYEIFREIIRVDRAYSADEFVVYCSAPVHEALSMDEHHQLAELKVYLGKGVNLRCDPMYPQDKFDVVMA